MSAPGQSAEFSRILASLAEVAEQLSGGDDDAEQLRFEEELARQNRSGERGRDWAIIQSRIDLKETTLADVMSGADESPEARRVTEVSRKNLSALREKMSEDSTEKPELLDPMAENDALLTEMQQRIQEIKSRFNFS